MAIESLRAGHFIPNKAGYPVSLAEEPKTAARKAAEEGLDDAAGDLQQAQAVITIADGGGRGDNVNVTA